MKTVQFTISKTNALKHYNYITGYENGKTKEGLNRIIKENCYINKGKFAVYPFPIGRLSAEEIEKRLQKLNINYKKIELESI